MVDAEGWLAERQAYWFESVEWGKGSEIACINAKNWFADVALILIAAFFSFWFLWRTRTILVYHFDWAAVPAFFGCGQQKTALPPGCCCKG